MKPMCRWRCAASSLSSRFETSSPCRRYVPDDGRSSSPSTFSSEDFPEPDGPMIETYSPASILRSMWSSACTTSSPTTYSRQIPESSIMALPSRVRLFRRDGRAVDDAVAIDGAHHSSAALDAAQDFRELPVRNARLDAA